MCLNGLGHIPPLTGIRTPVWGVLWQQPAVVKVIISTQLGVSAAHRCLSGEVWMSRFYLTASLITFLTFTFFLIYLCCILQPLRLAQHTLCQPCWIAVKHEYFKFYSECCLLYLWPWGLICFCPQSQQRFFFFLFFFFFLLNRSLSSSCSCSSFAELTLCMARKKHCIASWMVMWWLRSLHDHSAA